MKSVGEVMSIGGNFQESLQKGLRSLENDLDGFNELTEEKYSKKELKHKLSQTSPDRILLIAEALREGLSAKEICSITLFDPWFIEQIKEIIEWEELIKKEGIPKDKKNLKLMKSLGFSDSRLASLTEANESDIRELREKLDVRPVFKKVDTCAAEFQTNTDYMYSTYVGDIFSDEEYCESLPSDKSKVIILGGGPNRIGQGIELSLIHI